MDVKLGVLGCVEQQYLLHRGRMVPTNPHKYAPYSRRAILRLLNVAQVLILCLLLGTKFSSAAEKMKKHGQESVLVTGGADSSVDIWSNFS